MHHRESRYPTERQKSFSSPLTTGAIPRARSIPAGTSQVKFVVGASNSLNGTGTFTFSFNGVTGTFTATFPSFRPCTLEDVP